MPPSKVMKRRRCMCPHEPNRGETLAHQDARRDQSVYRRSFNCSSYADFFAGGNGGLDRSHQLPPIDANGSSRRIFLPAAHPGEGPLTEPTAAVPAWRPELVFMPLS